VSTLHLLLRRFTRGLVPLIAAAAFAAPVCAQTAAPIKVPTTEILAQHPRMTGFRLSPDGKHMIAIESQGDVRTVLVWKTEDLSAKPKVIGSNNMRIQTASFLKDDVLAVTLWQPYDGRIEGELTKTFINKLLVTDLEGKVWKEPLVSGDIARTDGSRRLGALAVPSVKNRMPRDPDHVIIESDGLGRDRDLFRYNVRTGEAVRVLRLSENDIEVVVDSSGRASAKTTGGSDSNGFFVATELRNTETGQWEEHFRSYVKQRDVVEIVSLVAGANTAVLRSSVGRDFAGLFEYDVKSRSIKSTLFEHKYFEALGVRSFAGEEPKEFGAFDAFTYDGLYGEDSVWLNPRFEGVIKGLAQSLGLREVAQELVDVAKGTRAEVRVYDGASINITGYHAGPEPTYLVRVTGLAYPTEHYLLKGQRLTLLAKEFPELDKRALGTSKLVYYKARDGLNIPAFLTVPNPALCGPGPYSAVIHPHGGPWSRDHMRFDSGGWVPLMASRCRVVLQPQFRGSAGWGRPLWVAGDAEWGQKMQDDKDDGAKWLASEKLADPARIAVFGFSYGGYAAFAASVRPKGLYKCAISGAGVSDIERIWAPFYTNPFYRDRQEPTVKGLSPLTLADKMTIPLMVYHGERDRIVPLIQSELFVDKARKSNQPLEYHVLPDYAHGPAWTRSTMSRHLGLIEKYFASGCGASGL
jgi:dipeptidyl aminopeptidase/acylaminoacyl peptidase